MAGSDDESECYEAASRLEHDIAPPLIDSGAALAAALFAVAARLSRALERLAGSAHRRHADGAHGSAMRST